MNAAPELPAVAVVIPTHDRATLLREAVDSVLAQTLPRWELVIVDDGSTDETPALLAGVHDPRIRSTRLDVSAERSAARNLGMRMAGAPFVLFLDDDDHLLPSALARLVRALERHTDAVAAVGGRVMFRSDGTRRRARHPRIDRVRSVRTDVFFDWVGFPSQTLFRRDMITRLGGWNEHLTRGEDRELWMRIAGRGPVAFVAEPVAEWRMRDATNAPDAESPAARRTRLLAARAATVRSLGTDERSATLLRASTRWVDGMNAYEAGRYREARSAFAAALRAAPQAVTSPLVGAHTRGMAARAFVGGAMGARTTAWARRALGTEARSRSAR